MSNMSYCRFQNTYRDLLDCQNALEEEDQLSPEEYRAAKNLLDVCENIGANYSEEDLIKEGEEEDEG